uniref:Uncharacterized protein n=1 Tax=viral metagenome TaxID=1070528 RepID=A0A6C0CFJ4_9ZZZZ
MYSLQPIFILYVLLTGSKGITLQQFYSGDLTCAKVSTLELFTFGTCTASPCTNVNNMFGTTTSCPNSIRPPSGWAYAQVWATSTTCAGTPDNTIALPQNTCSGIWSGASILLNCSAPVGQLGSIQDCGATIASCGGCPSKPAFKDGSCIVGNPTTSFTIASYIFTCPPPATTTVTTTPVTTRPANGAILMITWLLLLAILV